jgi:hypothetical protein
VAMPFMLNGGEDVRAFYRPLDHCVRFAAVEVRAFSSFGVSQDEVEI